MLCLLCGHDPCFLLLSLFSIVMLQLVLGVSRLSSPFSISASLLLSLVVCEPSTRHGALPSCRLMSANRESRGEACGDGSERCHKGGSADQGKGRPVVYMGFMSLRVLRNNMTIARKAWVSRTKRRRTAAWSKTSGRVR